MAIVLGTRILLCRQFCRWYVEPNSVFYSTY